MNIKIVSDGTPMGTQVINLDTGEPVGGVTEIKWEINADHFARVTLEYEGVPVEVHGEFVMSTELECLEEHF